MAAAVTAGTLEVAEGAQRTAARFLRGQAVALVLFGTAGEVELELLVDRVARPRVIHGATGDR